MTPEEVRDALAAMLERAVLNGNDLDETLGMILEAHREAVLKEADEAFQVVQAQHKALRDMDEVGLELMCAYRSVFDEYGFRDWLADNDGDEALEGIDALERKYAAATCQCCVFGNHSLPCTCDGTDCCHPEEYKAYAPERTHDKS